MSQCLLALLSTFYVPQCGYLLVKASVSNLNSIKCALESFSSLLSFPYLEIPFFFCLYRHCIHFIIVYFLMLSLFFFAWHVFVSALATRLAARSLSGNCAAFVQVCNDLMSINAWVWVEVFYLWARGCCMPWERVGEASGAAVQGSTRSCGGRKCFWFSILVMYFTCCCLRFIYICVCVCVCVVTIQMSAHKYSFGRKFSKDLFLVIILKGGHN